MCARRKSRARQQREREREGNQRLATPRGVREKLNWASCVSGAGLARSNESGKKRKKKNEGCPRHEKIEREREEIKRERQNNETSTHTHTH